VVISWLLIQVVGLAAESFEAPVWVMKMIITLAVIGFIPTLLFSWAFELTPEGLKKDADVARNDSIINVTAKKLNVITIIAAVSVTGLVIWQQMNSSAGTSVNIKSEVKQSVESTTEMTQPNNEISDKSIAVLPFVNMSSDKNQEYFADGISEEILNALVKATGLHVAGRTSSFSFKGKDATIKQIGAVLKVAYVLEGSVRKQNQNVRITAQLIKADDGFHLWSETYDGNLENIFDLQEDISRKVTEQLKIVLNLGVKQRLASKMTSNIDAYELFLRGREKVRKRIRNNIPEGISLLEEAVQLDPNFAEAWAKLAEAEAVLYGYVVLEDVNPSVKRAQSHVERALNLNDKLSLPYAVKGLMGEDKGRYIQAIEYYTEALDLEPNNQLAIRWLGNIYSKLGFDQKALSLTKKAYAIDPLSSIDTYNLAATHFKLGHLEKSIKFVKISSDIRNYMLDLTAFIYNYQGFKQKSVDYMLDIFYLDLTRSGGQNLLSEEQTRTYALGVFNGSEEQKQKARKIGNYLINTRGDLRAWQLKYYIALDDLDRVFEALNAKPYLFTTFAADDMWFPIRAIANFRADPRFVKLMVKYSLPTAWKKLGWPIYCQPNEGTDGSNGEFSCH